MCQHFHRSEGSYDGEPGYLVRAKVGRPMVVTRLRCSLGELLIKKLDILFQALIKQNTYGTLDFYSDPLYL